MRSHARSCLLVGYRAHVSRNAIGLARKRGRSDLGSRSGALDKGNRPGQSMRGAACRRCPGRLPCGRSRRWRRKDGRPIAALVPWLLAFSLSGRGFKRGSEGEGGARGRRAADPPTLRHHKKGLCGTSSAQVRHKCGPSAEQVRNKCGEQCGYRPVVPVGWPATTRGGRRLGRRGRQPSRQPSSHARCAERVVMAMVMGYEWANEINRKPA